MTILDQEAPRSQANNGDSLSHSLTRARARMSQPNFDPTNRSDKSAYADLSAVIDAISPHLLHEGIRFHQQVIRENDQLFLKTRIVKGEEEEAFLYPLFVDEGGSPHGVEYAMVYARRYSLMDFFGLVAYRIPF